MFHKNNIINISYWKYMMKRKLMNFFLSIKKISFVTIDNYHQYPHGNLNFFFIITHDTLIIGYSCKFILQILYC